MCSALQTQFKPLVYLCVQLSHSILPPSFCVLQVCRMGKYHNVLYIALKIAWNWGMKDSTVICTLLSKNFVVFIIKTSISDFIVFRLQFPDEIYECEKTFERLFLGAIFGSNAPFFIAGWRSDFKDQVKRQNSIYYFY